MNRALRDAPPTPAGGERHKLGVISGLSALSLDAMASVAYGPEAIVIVLALAGGAGLGFTLPVTISIAVLLGVLAFSYRQVIAAFPEGGGAYGVSKKYLGRRASLVAAASLVIDYVLNVAVSVAAGVAALTSAFPELLPYTVWVCLGVLAVITAINYGGIARSAQWFIAPTVIYVVSIIGVVVVGLFRAEPAVAEHAAAQAQAIETVGVLLLLKAFANGCAALTGVEAIANAVPSFKRPAVRRAQRAEVALAGLLAVMLIGIAALIEKFSIQPVQGVTVLSQVTEASLGDGIGYYVVQFATVVLLALAANTSFGGLPVLASLLARDNFLPHLFALRAEKQVYRYGIGFLAVTSAVLLIAANGNMNTLVPLFAIGVFVGFTLSQGGMVRHWLRERTQGWRWKLALNGTGAILTGVAAIVLTVTKFTEGGWLIVVLLPLIAVLMSGVNRAYSRIGASLGVDRVPAQPHAEPTVVVVPIGSVNALSSAAVSTALGLGDRVIAVRVTAPDDVEENLAFAEAWARWNPPVELVVLDDPRRRIAEPIAEFVGGIEAEHVIVLIAEVEPAHGWLRILQNQRGGVIARALRRQPAVIVSRLRFPIDWTPAPRDGNGESGAAPARAGGEDREHRALGAGASSWGDPGHMSSFRFR